MRPAVNHPRSDVDFEADLGRLLAVAQGLEEADCCLRNARVFNVFSGEILERQNVALAGDRIAYVGPAQAKVGDETQVIDCEDKILVPGYVDAHAHADYLMNPLALSDALLPLGTTAMNSYCEDIGGALGAKGIDYFLQVTAGLPLKIYLELPTSIPPDQKTDGPDLFPLPVLKQMLQNPRALSFGELYAWTRVLDRDPEILAKLALFSSQGIPIDGHTAGARDEKLQALVAAGFSSCHEAINAEEMLERLRLGLFVFLRHGSVRRDLEAFAPLIREKLHQLDTSRLVLVPDWMSPSDIVSRGYLNSLISEALELGLPPLLAYRMATINPATYLGLWQKLGAIAPGRKADILLLKDLLTPTPQLVLADGQVVAREGRILEPLNNRLTDPPKLCLEQLGYRRGSSVDPKDFVVRVATGVDKIEVPVIKILSKPLTVSEKMELPVAGGTIVLPEESDLLKVSVPATGGNSFVTGFVSGFGARIGGLATSIGFNCRRLLVLGSSDKDMALAFRRLVEIGGGLVIMEQGQEVSNFLLELGGVESLKSVPELAEDIREVEDYLRFKGCRLEDPLFSVHFLTFTWLPQVRMSSQGMIDVKTRKILFSSTNNNDSR